MAESDTYRTIEKPAKGMFRDRGSRFMAFAFPVHSAEEVKTILADLRKKYHDARHHCYAYRLGAAKQIYRTNDDGEPSGSAGKPIMGQIRAHDLSNILIVVIRYFGGTLLGVGGLIKAYRSAASDALKNAKTIKGQETIPLSIQYPYALTNEIMKIIDEENIRIISQDFTDTCRIEAQVRKSRTEQVFERINKLPGALAGSQNP